MRQVGIIRSLSLLITRIFQLNETWAGANWMVVSKEFFKTNMTILFTACNCTDSWGKCKNKLFARKGCKIFCLFVVKLRTFIPREEISTSCSPIPTGRARLKPLAVLRFSDSHLSSLPTLWHFLLYFTFDTNVTIRIRKYFCPVAGYSYSMGQFVFDPSHLSTTWMFVDKFRTGTWIRMKLESILNHQLIIIKNAQSQDWTFI